LIIAPSTSRTGQRSAVAIEVIGDGEDRAEIVRRMTPFRREPGVVEIEPANEAADVESRGHRIEDERRSRHARAIFQSRARNDRAEQARAGWIIQGEQRAAE
jgi:hypothetical protein